MTKFVILCHPVSMHSASMPKFAKMVGGGLVNRNYPVEYWSAPPLLYRFFNFSKKLGKWASYFDQFVVYRGLLWWWVQRRPNDTFFIVADQALGMLVPAIAKRPHAIHCHDFLALRSSNDEFPENKVSKTGKIYQKLIRNGFRKGRVFISISKATQNDLHQHLGARRILSNVVYNGLNYPFCRLSENDINKNFPVRIKEKLGQNDFILHVGGNQWYKNRAGVIELYEAWAASVEKPIPLLMIGAQPTEKLKLAGSKVKAGQVLFVSGLSDSEVHAAYCRASLLLFPSLAEGFGWPIAEAMACGTSVLTTGEAPMNEVGGDAAFYIRRRPNSDVAAWIEEGAAMIRKILSRDDMTVQKGSDLCVAQSMKFASDKAIDGYLDMYKLAGQAFKNENK